MNSEPADDPIGLLVIGYGNTLRGDDSAGRQVARALEQMHLAGVLVLQCDLLTPELAQTIAQARKVVFVDASVEESSPNVHLRALAAAESSRIMAHSAQPQTLLALARDVFGHLPQAWWLTIPVVTFEIGEDLSLKARAGIDEAIRRVKELSQRHPDV
jgi:hydrogenase maturation protease